jgi:hypothetical protein
MVGVAFMQRRCAGPSLAGCSLAGRRSVHRWREAAGGLLINGVAGRAEGDQVVHVVGAAAAGREQMVDAQLRPLAACAAIPAAVAVSLPHRFPDPLPRQFVQLGAARAGPPLFRNGLAHSPSAEFRCPAGIDRCASRAPVDPGGSSRSREESCRLFAFVHFELLRMFRGFVCDMSLWPGSTRLVSGVLYRLFVPRRAEICPIAFELGLPAAQLLRSGAPINQRDYIWRKSVLTRPTRLSAGRARRTRMVSAQLTPRKAVAVCLLPAWPIPSNVIQPVDEELALAVALCVEERKQHGLRWRVGGWRLVSRESRYRQCTTRRSPAVQPGVRSPLGEWPNVPAVAVHDVNRPVVIEGDSAPIRRPRHGENETPRTTEPPTYAPAEIDDEQRFSCIANRRDESSVGRPCRFEVADFGIRRVVRGAGDWNEAPQALPIRPNDV